MSLTWPKIRLSEVVRDLTPNRIIQVRDDDSIVDPTISSATHTISAAGRRRGFEVKVRKRVRIEPGDLVFSRLHTQNGAFAFSDETFQATGTFIPLEIKESRVERRFLFWALHKFVPSLSASDTVGRETFKTDEILALQFPLAPLEEQRRVVAQIEELGAQIHEARNLRQQAAKEAEALYGCQLSVAMRPHGEGWKRDTIANVIVSIDAGWSPQCDDTPAAAGEWGVLKTTAVQWCEFQPNQNKRLPPTLNPIPELAVKEGDVLITRAGPLKRVGVVAAVRQDEPQLTISDKLIRLRTNRDKIDPRFLELSLASPFSQEHLVQRKTGLADAQVNISQAILMATPLAYPSLHEQRRIEAELEILKAEVDALKRLQTETFAELDALLPSILDKAFRGEL